MTTEAKKLAEENLGLARFVAHRFKTDKVQYEDLEAEAFMGLVKAASGYDASKAKFATYAVRVIQNQILKSMRRKSPDTVSFEEKVGEWRLEDTLGADCTELERAENALFLRQAMQRLSVRERAVLHEIYWNNASQEEVAKRLGSHQPNVSRTHKAAIQKLRAVAVK